MSKYTLFDKTTNKIVISSNIYTDIEDEVNGNTELVNHKLKLIQDKL